MIKIRKVRTALRIVLILMLGCLMTSIEAQESIPDTLDKEIQTQVDRDWEELQKSMGSLGAAGTYEAAKKISLLEMQKHEDKCNKKSSRLAQVFWDNYPQDDRHEKALYLFFHMYAEPHFIPNEIPDSLVQTLAEIPRKEYRKYMRLLPTDNAAMKQWLKKGNDMVASIVSSNVSLERKESAEFQLISREFRMALKLSYAFEKEKAETAYWNRMEIQYWKHICLSLENHVNKYAALHIVADRVQNILSLLKSFSPAASDAYWKYFYKTTTDNNPLSNQLGIEALHAMAAKNVEAIEALKLTDYSKPLEMEFTAIDGSKVELAKLRGKVVLIDFWSTWCGPCIKEMPHVRAMYDKYHDKGFEVIGLAADGDENKDRVQSILKKTGANWPQRLDLGSDADVSFHALYKIKALPTVWLLNKEGVIVDRQARGKRLEPLIRQYLGIKDE